MSEEHFRFICDKTHRQPLYKTSRTLCSVSGHTLPVVGEVDLSVGYDTLRTVVVKNLPHEVIIGGDCLWDGAGVINYKDRTVNIYDQVYPFTV